MFSSEAETPTMAATSASWAEKEGGVSVKAMGSSRGVGIRLYWPAAGPAIAVRPQAGRRPVLTPGRGGQ